MNRRDFLRLLAQSAAAVPISYFVFGSGIWRPNLGLELLDVIKCPPVPDIWIMDDVTSGPDIYVEGFDEMIAGLVKDGALRIEPVPDDTPLRRMLNVCQPRAQGS